ncbi:MAG: YbaK/EbsC family protein [Acidimicrobiales bacterium]
MSHPNADRVAAAARDLGLTVEVAEFPEGTRTAADAAAAIGVDVGQIVKSLVFAVDDEVVVALVSGPNRLDERALAELAGGAGSVVGRVGADQVRAATGFPIGGVPPLGHAAELRTFLDEDLMQHQVVWAAAGTPRHVFSVDPTALATATGAVVGPLRSDDPAPA